MPGATISTGRACVGDDRPFAVERIAERIDDAADHGVADGHAQQLAGRADFVAFADLRGSRRG